jgi:hypothetical protein
MAKRKKTAAAELPPARIARVAKGKKPQYFSDPATDKLLWMTVTLMEELSVTRDRLDTVERVLAKKRVLKRGDIDNYKPDTRSAAERDQLRKAFIDRMMRAVHAELEEATSRGANRPDDDPIAAVEA